MSAGLCGVELPRSHQLPDPTIVTLCFLSWDPRDAIFLGEAVDSCLVGDDARRDDERLDRRRKADEAVVAILAVEKW